MNRARMIFGAAALLIIIAVLFLGIPRILNQTPPTNDQQPPAVSQKTSTSVSGSMPDIQPSTVPQKPTRAPVVIPPEDGNVVVTFAIYSFLGEAYQPVIEEFHMQHPEITIQVRELPMTNDYRQIASTADTTILMFSTPGASNYFLDVTPLEEGDPAFKPDKYWPGILDACMDSEGRIYGLPIFAEPKGIFYQEKAFDAAGLPYPKPGWTWDDFQKTVNVLARTENGLPVYGFADDSFIDTPDETLLSPRISFLLDQTGGEIDVDLFAREFQWYLGLIQSGSLYSENIFPQQSPVLHPENAAAWSKAFNNAWKVTQQMYQKNPPAMWKGRLDQTFKGDITLEAMPDGSLSMSNGSSGARSIIQDRQEIGWAPFPISADGQNDHTTPTTVTCAAISAGTEHPRSAWAWLNYLAAHPILPEWSIAAPAQPSATEASGYWGKIPEKLRQPVEFALEHGWYSNPFPETVMAINQALLKTATEKTDFQVALQEAKSQVQAAVMPTPDLSPIVVATPNPTVPPSVITLDYYSPFFGGTDRSKNLAEEFNRIYPEISVQIAAPTTVQGISELADSFDCFAWFPEDDMPANQLVELGQYLSNEETDIRNDYNPQELAEYSRDGKLFGLPTAYQPYLIYYNADLLAQRGIKPPSIEWTYADFMELVNAAASNNAGKPVYGLNLEYPTQDFDLFLAGRNVSLVDASGDVPAFLFDIPETRDTLQWMAEQVKTGVIFPVNSVAIGTHKENAGAARQLILDGRVAFWMSWYDPVYGGAYNLQDAKFSIGVAPLPLPEGSATWRPIQLALGQYISKKAKEPRACWAWMKFLSEQPNKEYGVPARRSFRESENWVAQVGADTAKVYQAAIEQRRLLSQEYIYSLGPTRDWWNELLAEVIYGANPLQLLVGLQGKADAYSACLAASSDYQTGNAQLKSQAEDKCAVQVNPK